MRFHHHILQPWVRVLGAACWLLQRSPTLGNSHVCANTTYTLCNAINSWLSVLHSPQLFPAGLPRRGCPDTSQSQTRQAVHMAALTSVLATNLTLLTVSLTDTWCALSVPQAPLS
ncbi:hypothetical protein BsWGS_24704 [Bradybaena similaris]